MDRTGRDGNDVRDEFGDAESQATHPRDLFYGKSSFLRIEDARKIRSCRYVYSCRENETATSTTGKIVVKANIVLLGRGTKLSSLQRREMEKNPVTQRQFFKTRTSSTPREENEFLSF